MRVTKLSRLVVLLVVLWLSPAGATVITYQVITDTTCQRDLVSAAADGPNQLKFVTAKHDRKTTMSIAFPNHDIPPDAVPELEAFLAQYLAAQGFQMGPTDVVIENESWRFHRSGEDHVYVTYHGEQPLRGKSLQLAKEAGTKLIGDSAPIDYTAEAIFVKGSWSDFIADKEVEIEFTKDGLARIAREESKTTNPILATATQDVRNSIGDDARVSDMKVTSQNNGVPLRVTGRRSALRIEEIQRTIIEQTMDFGE